MSREFALVCGIVMGLAIGLSMGKPAVETQSDVELVMEDVIIESGDTVTVGSEMLLDEVVVVR
jgi:hypothetical protein